MSSQWVLTFLSNALWQPLVITSSALAWDRLMRNLPARRQRHNLWDGDDVLCAAPLSSAPPAFSTKKRSPCHSREPILIQAETNDSTPPFADAIRVGRIFSPTLSNVLPVSGPRHSHSSLLFSLSSDFTAPSCGAPKKRRKRSEQDRTGGRFLNGSH